MDRISPPRSPLGDTLSNDIRFGLRILSRKPLLTGIAILTLALGIGASTAVYSVVHGVLFKGLEYPRADRLAMIWTRFDTQGIARAPAAGPEIVDLRRDSALFEDFAGIWPRFGSLGGVDDPEQIHIGWVTGNFFDVLGVGAYLGRSFLPEEDVPNGPSVILLSHEVWQRRYGGDESIVGDTVEFNNAAFTVVGIMPPGFQVMMPPDAGLPTFGAWLPWQGEYSEMRRGFRVFRLIGRLAPGASFAAARSELEAIAERMSEANVDYAESGFGVEVRPLHADLVAPVRPALLALSGAVAFVVLIACANVANLLLVRSAAREREMALRCALGAGRGRVVRQLMTESLLLFFFGGVAGLAVAWASLELLEYLRPEGLPRLEAISLDRSALAFNFLAVLLTGLVFGNLPATQAARVNLTAALKEGGRAAGGRQRLRNFMVVGEVALSAMLLFGAGLMVRSFTALGRVDPGFRSEDVLTARMSLPFTSYPYSDPAKISAFYQQLADRVAELPGVEAAGTTDFPPLLGLSSAGEPYAFETPGGESEWGSRSADYRIVTPGYHLAMGTRLIAGRHLDAHDDLDHPLVVLVDEKLARIAWPGQNPIGRRLKVNVFLRETTAKWAEVVGVVEHVRYGALDAEGREQVYISHLQSPRRSMTLAIKSTLDAASLAAAVRREVRTIDPSRPIFDVRPLSAYEADAKAEMRFVLVLLGIFAALAVVLAAVGLYGVISYLVRQSTREIGVRMALGARGAQILSRVLGRGLALAAAGLALGLALALALGRSMASLVFGVSVHDSATLMGVAAVVLTVALWASFFPARQATHVDPMTALRCD